jgi:hypothetical protein
MSTGKWTPGPWRVRALINPSAWEVVGDFNTGSAAGWIRVCEIPERFTSVGPRAIDDANVIAATPELYEALDMALRLLHKTGWSNPDHPIWTIGPTALAKARGESHA